MYLFEIRNWMHHLESSCKFCIYDNELLLDVRCPLGNAFFLRPRSYFTTFISYRIILPTVLKNGFHRWSSRCLYTAGFAARYDCAGSKPQAYNPRKVNGEHNGVTISYPVWAETRFNHPLNRRVLNFPDDQFYVCSGPSLF